MLLHILLTNASFREEEADITSQRARSGRIPLTRVRIQEGWRTAAAS